MLAKLVGVEATPGELEALARALCEHLDAMAAFERVDLTDIDPAVIFAPRWDE